MDKDEVVARVQAVVSSGGTTLAPDVMVAVAEELGIDTTHSPLTSGGDTSGSTPDLTMGRPVAGHAPAPLQADHEKASKKDSEAGPIKDEETADVESDAGVVQTDAREDDVDTSKLDKEQDKRRKAAKEARNA